MVIICKTLIFSWVIVGSIINLVFINTKKGEKLLNEGSLLSNIIAITISVFASPYWMLSACIKNFKKEDGI